ncbi:MAG: hypothetical protein HY873_07015 [Chloroflexi bacterium]|nr:hypothetical protein [Chloroflexota bacterium]
MKYWAHTGIIYRQWHPLLVVSPCIAEVLAKEGWSKDDLKRELERSYSRLQRFLANQAQLDATYTSDWDGRKYDGHWIAFHLLEHDIHHRAELMQRLALLDVEHRIDL